MDIPTSYSADVDISTNTEVVHINVRNKTFKIRNKADKAKPIKMANSNNVKKQYQAKNQSRKHKTR